MGININLWFKDLKSMTDGDLFELNQMILEGMVPMSDWYDFMNKITWEQRIDDVHTEMKRRNVL